MFDYHDKALRATVSIKYDIEDTIIIRPSMIDPRQFNVMVVTAEGVETTIKCSVKHLRDLHEQLGSVIEAVSVYER